MNLWNLLHESRQLFETMLRSSLGHRQTAGTCAFASFFVDFSIKRWMPELKSCVRGGDGEADGGYFEPNGRGHGHYWVEIDDGTDKWVADITADQFGGEPISLIRLADSVERYRPGNPDLVTEHMVLFQEWIEESRTEAEPS